MSCPVSAVAAATHPDPYPWYSRLAVDRPLSFHAEEGIWVAASAGVVEAVLASLICRVRPVDEPVPEALAGTPAGEVFSRLVRMNDGPWQAALKEALIDVLGAVDPADVRRLTHLRAGELLEQPRYRDDLTGFSFTLPAQVVGSLLGVPHERLNDVPRWTGEFVAAITPGASAEQVENGGLAVAHLQEMLLTVEGGLTAALEARSVERDVAIANGIGFLFQSYDATAGLICNTLRALATVTEAIESYRSDPGSLAAIVGDVSRCDPAIQNTRRFVAEDGVVGGQQMRAGDTILLLLAAANRDPALSGDADSLSFGYGAHRCPGEGIALEIATAGVECLLAAGIDPSALAGPVEYRPSVNARIPVFGTGESM